MRIAFDCSAVIWKSLRAGQDPLGRKVEFNGKTEHINSTAYGYERAVNHILNSLQKFNLQPKDTILVVEGANSKAPRLMINPGYKQGADKCPEWYTHFNEVKHQIVDLFRSVGAIALVQDNCEGDDVLGWLAKHTRRDLIIDSVDNDLTVLNGTNEYGAKIEVCISGEVGVNKYGAFDFKYVSLYKAMVGDPSDKIKGIPGFGHESWVKFDAEFGSEGMDTMIRMAELGNLDEIAMDAQEHKLIKKIYDGRDSFLNSYRLAKIHPEWVNRPKDPMQWLPGFPQAGRHADERINKFRGQMRLVTADNFDAALTFLKSKVAETPFFGVDLETSTPEESDDWLAAREAENKVDVISSTITGGSINFGANGQYCYYISVEHTDTKNVTMEQFAQMLQAIPPEKLSVAHNAQGFELPVLYKNLSKYFGDNGWRGFMPNMADTRIAASWWDENQYNFGLKQLSKLLFGYDQVSYAEVTGGKKMNQIPAEQVVHYGCDDSYTAFGLWNFFSTVMEFEGTLPDFHKVEQKPMYLQAMAYVEGIKIDLPRLMKLKKQDEESAVALRGVLDAYLISKGWEGSTAPVVTADNLDPAMVKTIFHIVTGKELETRVRKLERLVEEVRQQGSPELASFIAAGDYDSINKLIKLKFKAAPIFNVGSPTQLTELMFTTMGAPIRLRNDATDAMKARGQTEGNPRTDEDVMKLAINMGDVSPEEVKVLEALIELKSIQTRTGLYWNAYPGMIHWETGKIHPSFKQSGTNTRRYSSSDPNFQQQDSNPDGVRSVVLPHHSNAVIISMDESGQELRIAAELSGDENMRSAYIGDNKRDLHAMVGSQIMGIEYQEFMRRLGDGDAECKKARQAGKVVNFAGLYGAGASKIGEGLGVEKSIAQGYIDSKNKAFPGLLAYAAESETLARDTGLVPLIGGGVRHLASLINSTDNFTAAKAVRQAGNARIQGSGGNQIKRVMTRIWDSDLIEKYDYRWVMSVHDETIHSVSKEHALPVAKVLHGFMTEQFLETVPSVSSIGIGRNFGQLIEIGEEMDEVKFQEALDTLFK